MKREISPRPLRKRRARSLSERSGEEGDRHAHKRQRRGQTGQAHDMGRCTEVLAAQDVEHEERKAERECKDHNHGIDCVDSEDSTWISGFGTLPEIRALFANVAARDVTHLRFGLVCECIC